MSLNGLNNIYKIPNFSHIYVEQKAKTHPQTQQILERFKNACVVTIEHHKNILNRFNQDFQLQKESLNLILAIKEPPFIYKTSADIIGDVGVQDIYYASSILNCLYHCDYCYLQGVYPSANLVVYVNIEEFVSNALKLAQEKEGAYVAISYDSDLLAFEKKIPHSAAWIEAAIKEPRLNIELRTKSSNYSSISHLSPKENIVLAWTLSPQEIIQVYEKRTASLKARVSSIQEAIQDGWKIRICFDPLLRIEGWKSIYGEFVEDVFQSLNPSGIKDVCINVFRMNTQYLKRIQKQNKSSSIVYDPFVEDSKKVMSYPDAVKKELIQWVAHKTSAYIPEEKIFCTSS